MSTETKYYETVDVAELPVVEGVYMTRWEGVPAWTEKEFKDGRWQTRFENTGLLTHWLRPVNLSDIIREAAGKAFDAGMQREFDNQFGSVPTKAPNKETYLNNL